MKRVLTFLSLSLLAALALVALADPAFAAAAGTTTTTTVAANPSTTTTVSLTPFYTYLNEFVDLFLSGLAAVVVGWVIFLFNKYVGPYLPAQFRAALDARASTALNTALANGVPIALHQLDAWETVHQSVDVQNKVLAKAASYALEHAPDAAAHFDLGPDELAKKALAFVPPPPASSAAKA